MDTNTVVYEAVCANPAGLTLKLSFSVSPLWSGAHLAYITCFFNDPTARPTWSRQIRSGRGLLRWLVRTCSEWARVSLTADAFLEMTDALWRTDVRLGRQSVAAQVAYLIERFVSCHESRPPTPPTLAELIGRRARWLDRDGGGGGYIGWAFRESLRQAAMKRFVEEHLLKPTVRLPQEFMHSA